MIHAASMCFWETRGSTRNNSGRRRAGGVADRGDAAEVRQLKAELWRVTEDPSVCYSVKRFVFMMNTSWMLQVGRRWA